MRACDLPSASRIGGVPQGGRRSARSTLPAGDRWGSSSTVRAPALYAVRWWFESTLPYQHRPLHGCYGTRASPDAGGFESTLPYHLCDCQGGPSPTRGRIPVSARRRRAARTGAARGCATRREVGNVDAPPDRRGVEEEGGGTRGRTNNPRARRPGDYGRSTEPMTWTTPFEAEISVATTPAESSWLRVSLSPFSIW